MGFNIAGAIAGFVAESHKLHKEANEDSTLKLKQSASADNHALTQAKIYKLMSGGSKGATSKPMSEYQRAMLPERQAKARREDEKFQLQKEGKWDPSGRGSRGGIQIPSVESATDFGGTKPALPATRTFTPAAPVATNSSNASSVPAPEDTEEPEEPEEEEDDTEAEPEQPEPKMASGGMVPAVGRYADGGAAQQFPPVQDNDASQTAAAPAPTPAVGGPAPQAAAPAAPPPAAPPAKPKGWKNSIGFDTTEVMDSWRNAPDPGDKSEAKQGAIGGTATPKKDPADVNPIRFGLSAMQEFYSASKGASALDNGHSAMAEGIKKKPNAMTDQQYQQVAKVVDPHDELTEGARLIASLNAGVKNALAKGDTKSAKALAVGMVEMSAINSEKYGRYAMELMQKGDTQGAVHFLQKAYDVMPDGKELDAFVGKDGLVHARTRDSEGNVQDLGAFGGQQLMKVATGVANGSVYWQTMSRLAGMKPDKAAVEKAPKEPTPGVYAVAHRNVKEELDAPVTTKEGKAEKKHPIPDEFREDFHNIATDITSRNAATPGDALRAVNSLSDSDVKPKLLPGGSGVFKLDNGTEYTLGKNAIAQLALLRARVAPFKKKEAEEAAAKTATEDKKKALVTQQSKQLDEQRQADKEHRRAMKEKAYGAMGGYDAP